MVVCNCVCVCMCVCESECDPSFLFSLLFSLSLSLSNRRGTHRSGGCDDKRQRHQFEKNRHNRRFSTENVCVCVCVCLTEKGKRNEIHSLSFFSKGTQHVIDTELCPSPHMYTHIHTHTHTHTNSHTLTPFLFSPTLSFTVLNLSVQQYHMHTHTSSHKD